jgi:hypothetical protein
MDRAFGEDKDSYANNAIINIILTLAEERKTFVLTDDVKPKMNIRNYANILSAA